MFNTIIPFWGDVTYTGWDKGMKLYVLVAGASKYAEDCYLYNKKGELPPEWGHGYSRGNSDQREEERDLLLARDRVDCRS